MTKKGKLGLIAGLSVPVSVGIYAGIGAVSCSSDAINTVCLLNFNDFHGAAPGYGDGDYPLETSYKNPGIERVAKFIYQFEQENPNTVLLSAGDNNSGDSFSTSNHGQLLFPLLKELGVRYSAVGNHAFEWGLNYLNSEYFDKWARTDETQGKYFVCANILNNNEYTDKEWVINPRKSGFDEDYTLWKNQLVRWADPYKVMDINGNKICLIGLTTNESLTDGNIKVTSQLSFINYNASVNYAKYLAHEELGDKEFNRIESFVLLTHVESDFLQDEQKQFTIVDPESTCAVLAKTLTTDVDAIISAHSHKKGAGKIHSAILKKNIWIGQASTAGRALLETKLTFDNNRPMGERLVDISMNVHDISIDYGNHDPESYAGYQAANDELNGVRIWSYDSGKDTMPHRIRDLFKKDTDDLSESFKQKVGAGKTHGQKFPFANERDRLGHSYIWPAEKEGGGSIENIPDDKNYIDEEMGAWINYAQMKGFDEIAKSEGEKLTPSSISFSNFDSITHIFEPSINGHQITYGDLYQLQTYENSLYYGYLTIPQLCNIIEFNLTGEGLFDYVTKERCDTTIQDKYNFNFQYNNIEGYNHEQVLDISNKPSYLCSPLQFWGMRFEVKKLVTPDMEDGKVLRRWKLDYKDDAKFPGKKIPKLWIYDGTDPDESLNDPTTWKSAEEWHVEDPTFKLKPIPIVFNSFIWQGANYQTEMFKLYCEYNGGVVALPELSRDALITFCLGFKKKSEFIDIMEDSNPAHTVVQFNPA